MRRNELFVSEVDEEEAQSMHSHGFDFKKTGGFLRMSHRKDSDKAIPEYEIEPMEFGLKRKVMEHCVELQFRISQWPVSRRIINTIPISLIGCIFKYARKSWMRKTR